MAGGLGRIRLAALLSPDGLVEAIRSGGKKSGLGVSSSSLLPTRFVCGEVFRQRGGLTIADATLELSLKVNTVKQVFFFFFFPHWDLPEAPEGLPVTSPAVAHAGCWCCQTHTSTGTVGWLVFGFVLFFLGLIRGKD